MEEKLFITDCMIYARSDTAKDGEEAETARHGGERDDEYSIGTGKPVHACRCI